MESLPAPGLRIEMPSAPVRAHLVLACLQPECLEFECLEKDSRVPSAQTQAGALIRFRALLGQLARG